MMILHGLITITLCTVLVSSSLTTQVIHSAVLEFAPWLELHHIVLVKDTLCKGAYTIDFSPLNQTEVKTLKKLLIGRSVPGEVRVRYIPEEHLTITAIKDNLMCSDLSLTALGDMLHEVSTMGPFRFLRRNKEYTALETKEERDRYRIAHRKIKNRKVANAVLKIVDGWDANMNFYVHNCQHFSKFCLKSINSLEGTKESRIIKPLIPNSIKLKYI